MIQLLVILNYMFVFNLIQWELPGVLDSYILYVNNSATSAIVGRQEGASFVNTLATVTMNPGLNTTDLYRMRLRTTGVSPVVVEGAIERWDGSSWEEIGRAVVNDNDATRIITPGSVGFSGYVESSYRYDNFYTVRLNPWCCK